MLNEKKTSKAFWKEAFENTPGTVLLGKTD